MQISSNSPGSLKAPRHLAVIMDGNGRWATEKGKRRNQKLTLKTREFEIGVLLSLGASKLKIMAQFFVELAIVALLGFTLSVGTGSLISKQVGTALLENQIQEADINEEEDYFGDDWINVWDSNYVTKVSLEDFTAEYDATISPVVIAEIYVVGLAIVALSIVIPSVMIMRFNPKKILMNQG